MKPDIPKQNDGEACGKRSGFATFVRRKLFFFVDFRTLGEFPLPSRAVPFAVLCFCLLGWAWYRHVDPAEAHFGGSSLFPCFRYLERLSPDDPVVLIGGGSLSLCGIVREDFEKHLKKPVVKTYVGSYSPWEWCRLFEKHRASLRSVDVLVMDMSLRRFVHYGSKRRLERYKMLKRPGEPYPYEGVRRKEVDFAMRYLPMKVSLRSVTDILALRGRPFDVNDDRAAYNPMTATEKTLERYRGYRHAVELRGSPVSEATDYSKRVDDGMIRHARRIVEFCRENDVFPVVLATPMIHGTPVGLPDISTRDVGKRKYLNLLWDIDHDPNGMVVAVRNFEDIHPGIDDTALFYDDYHMTVRGAELYTTWLGERLMHNEKFVAALNRSDSKRTRETFVAKYFRDRYETLRKQWAGPPKKKRKKKPASGDPERVRVASPPTDPVR